MAVEEAGGPEGDGGLQVDVGRVDAVFVVHVGGGVDAGLGLHDFVEEGGVDGGRGDISRIAAIGSQGANEGRVILLVDDCRGVWEDAVGGQGAVEVGGDGDQVVDEGFAGPWPVFQTPLAGEVSCEEEGLARWRT